MNKKRIGLLIGLIVILSGWWITRSSSPARPEEGVIDVWSTWGDEADQLQELFDSYTQESGISVRVTTWIRSDDLLEVLRGERQPDLVILSSADPLTSYAEQGLVEPLDRWIESTRLDMKDIYPAPLEQCKSMDGGYLCLPWGCDTSALYWNKGLFEAAGLDPARPPQTMEEVVEYADQLTLRNEDGELIQAGFIPGYPSSHTDLYNKMFAKPSIGFDQVELSDDSSPARDALNWQNQFSSIYTPGELDDFVSTITPYMTSGHPVFNGRRLSCQQCHRASPMQNKRIPSIGFYEGQIAMMLDGEWGVSSNSLSKQHPRLNFEVAPFPPPSHPERANTAVVQGPVVIIPAGAIDKDAAAQLLAWMNSPEILAEVAYTHSMLPTSRKAAQDQRFHKSPQFELFLDLIAHH
jgi:ABC-type glycerol-3-phosphate transport system substrate-binding protein